PGIIAVRILVYFSVATMLTCVATAFAVSLMVQSRLGSPSGFFVILLVGLPVGVLPSLLLAGLITLAARKTGADKWWIWLAAGTLLGPALELLLLSMPQSAWPALAVLLSGPYQLVRVWWLLFPIGLITGFACFEMYPWAFRRS